MSLANLIQSSQRIIFKVGSSLLVNRKKNVIDYPWFASFIEDVAELHHRKKEILIVSSGTVALGRRLLDVKQDKKLRLERKRAAASIGQVDLAYTYRQFFGHYNIFTSQVLLTLEDSDQRQRFLNAKDTLCTLLESKVIPIINENDTVATVEASVGDNDRLAARVAGMVGADLLVILSDIDGLYTDNPRTNPDAGFIEVVEKITPEITAMAGGAGSVVGTGGMITKVIAAGIASNSGCHTIITNGDSFHPLTALMQGEKRGTWFKSIISTQNARKQWILGCLQKSAAVQIDAGAEKALLGGKSLLPAGVMRIIGEFSRGDCVTVLNETGTEIGYGIIGFDSSESRIIMKHHSDDIQKLLGYQTNSALIHRDNLVLK